jgi:hypothetical protein
MTLTAQEITRPPRGWEKSFLDKTGEYAVTGYSAERPHREAPGKID